jgi:predicted alpha/beta superfamily hydrolase
VKALLGLALMLSPVAAPAQAEPWQLARSEVQTATAADGHVYRLLVAWPEGEPPAAGWPVLWVLDGEDNFATVVLTARRLARAGERSGVAPGVIVGIDSGPLARRVLDYTPPSQGYAIPAGLPAHGLAIGGADAFLDLLDSRFRTQIARQWPIDPARQALLGHSFGGLLGLHALRTDRSFAAVVVVSPSLWYANGAIAQADRPAPVRSRLLVASGTAKGGPNGQNAAAAEALVARWRAGGLEARFLPLEGQTHGSTMLAAMGAAISFAFAEERP